MQSSKLGYQAWAVNFDMALTNLNGSWSKKLHRELGMTQVPAWHMLQRIRNVFRNSDAIPAATVEIDEIFIGGNERNKHDYKSLKADRGTVGKTALIGAKERGGKVAAKPIPAMEAKTLGEFVAGTVEPDSAVCTDAANTYASLREYNCNVVSLSAGEYVRGSTRATSIEGFWSLFERGHFGIFRGMTVKHLHQCLTEFTGRARIRNMNILDQTTHKAGPMDGKMFT